jgi:hypothetical protein
MFRATTSGYPQVQSAGFKAWTDHTFSPWHGCAHVAVGGAVAVLDPEATEEGEDSGTIHGTLGLGPLED